jgi:hypothetical protein
VLAFTPSEKYRTALKPRGSEVARTPAPGSNDSSSARSYHFSLYERNGETVMYPAFGEALMFTWC